MKPCDWLIRHANIVTFSNESEKDTKHRQNDPYGMIENATVAISGNKIDFVGHDEQWDAVQANYTVAHEIDALGQWLTPGLVDCHTHLVFGGNRAQEFEWRLQGQSYENIAKKGGGILSSVKHTRALNDKQLLKQSVPRLKRLLEEGVTTVEIKSGYGLDVESELKMLRVARALGDKFPVTVQTTFLGAHALPPEYRDIENGHSQYIHYVCEEIMPKVVEQGLADAVDVFCEGIGFTPQDCETVFTAAVEFGLPIKGHVEQLSDLKGAVLAAKYNALSVDHIEYLHEDDVPHLKDTVAVLLPAAFYCLNETQKPPIDTLRKHNIPMAVATDLNPGTAPVASLLTAMNQACILFGLTPAEALKGATTYGAQALGLNNKGRIEQGMDADLCLWDIQHPAELSYGVNFHRPNKIWQMGQYLCNRNVAIKKP